jgi:hypothetical protein
MEGVARHAARIDAHDAERARRVVAQDQRGVDAFAAQRREQPLAGRVGRQAAQEGHRPPEPRQPLRDVERRAADARVERHAGGRCVAHVDIHQRFATDHEHDGCS